MKIAPVGVISLFMLSLGHFASANETPDLANMLSAPVSQECRNRVQGEFRFGQFGDACDSAVYGRDNQVFSKYSPLVFDERNASEADRYVPLFKAILIETADSYLAQRRRVVSPQERLAWRRAILALAQHESLWSHYRIAKTDARLKFIRGDNDHGYGLLQIDDRWHKDMIQSARAWDLTGNLYYGMDLFFKGWERALKSGCINVSSFEERARSAYSYFNGGPAKVCRWKNSQDEWARNDKAYFAKFTAEVWKTIPTVAAPLKLELR